MSGACIITFTPHPLKKMYEILSVQKYNKEVKQKITHRETGF